MLLKAFQTYTLFIPSGALEDEKGIVNEAFEFAFSTVNQIDRIEYTNNYVMGI